MTISATSGSTRRPGPSTAWPLNRQPRDYVLGHVRAVLPETIIEDAWIAVRDGRIVDVGPHPSGAAADTDAGGLVCLPGLIDVHSDALEREARPRPTAELPWDFALLSLEAKMAAAGVTTVFHGAAFQKLNARGIERSAQTALSVCSAIDAHHGGPVDHRILHRLDVRSPDGTDQLRQRLAERGADGTPALVSHEDHTPGQGQYTDRTQMERYLVGADGLSPEAAREHVTGLIAERGRLAHVREESLGWLGGLARGGVIRLLGHDPDSASEIAGLAERGGAVAEFPTTLEAAQAARDAGMQIVMGAPNVLRGGSHSGNVSAVDLAERGLVDALASDYLPSGLLASVWQLTERGKVPLPRAARLVTAGPAAVAGLADRGSLLPGQRADLALVDDSARWPVVRSVLTTEHFEAGGEAGEYREPQGKE